MRRNGVAEFNYPLLIGGLITAAFILLAIIGPFLTDQDPMADNRTMRIDGEWVTAPFRPGEIEGFPLGSDEIGRDILTRILWGIRPTLMVALVVVAVRMGGGLLLGLTAGWYGGRFERFVEGFIGAALAIPILVFAIAAITYIGLERGLMAFVVALSITGWAETANFVKDRTRAIMQAPYIEGAHAVGQRPNRILTRYVLPQLWPVLPAMVAFELAAVVLLIAELGFLGIFIGGGVQFDVPDPLSPGVILIRTSGQPELGQLLSDFWAKIIQTPWVPFLVGFTVFLQIFGFNMLGEGLRRYLDVTRPSTRLSLARIFSGNKPEPVYGEGLGVHT
jgi:ABC-type dipeptide/oligopeptide/nickel transport system permease subunit